MTLEEIKRDSIGRRQWRVRGPCSIEGCSKPHIARGRCHRHYRWLREEPPKFWTAESKFWAYVDKGSGNDCWRWTGSLTGCNYGRFIVDGTLHLAHRLSYELHVGPIPDGLVIDHLCFNTRCVNPEHLEPVTSGENVRRSNAARLARGEAIGFQLRRTST